MIKYEKLQLVTAHNFHYLDLILLKIKQKNKVLSTLTRTCDFRVGDSVSIVTDVALVVVVGVLTLDGVDVVRVTDGYYKRKVLQESVYFNNL